jgi:phosphoadenosine phosphosulfate reductase
MSQLAHSPEAPAAYTVEQIEADALLLEGAAPRQVLEWAYEKFQGRVAIATGFGAEGAALIDIAAKINPDPNVFFLDTDFLFPETYDLRRRIEERYGIRIRAFRPALRPEEQEATYGASLWSRDPDLCCRIRKVEPLERALEGLDGWITAIRRDQTAERRSARVVEWDARRRLVKINPLVAWAKGDVWNYIAENDVPYNPLHDQGYPSIGCTHCTRAVRDGEDDRAGRWSGYVKKECGLHYAGERAIAQSQIAAPLQMKFDV